jgi:peptidoglycan hydrolase-like protein with peptidoglycan-binding domain
VSGQVTSSATWTIGAPGGSNPDGVATAADAAVAARTQLATARSVLSAATRTRALIRAGRDAAVAHAPTGTARTEAIRARRLDRIQQDQTVGLARAAVADAERALDTAERALTSQRRIEAVPGGTLTSMAPVGGRVSRGGTVYALDGRPTVLLLGDIPAWRALREGDEGPDVAQLAANLVALGFGGSPAIPMDGSFDASVTQAVRRWQTALGLDPSGVVRLGDVVVLPAEVNVTVARVAIGGAPQPGTPMLDVASTDEVVVLALDPGLAPSVHVGDPIRFRTEDGTDVPGSVTSVGEPAVSTDGGPNGQSGQLQVAVVATADDPATLTGLDGLTLTADVTTGTAPDALAVPVAALVVLGDGSFGLEITSAGATHFIRVTPGIYDRTMVQVEGDGIAEGDQVVVPGT